MVDTIFLNSTALSQMGWQNAYNASRSGSDSSAARWLNSESRIVMPAKKAPSA
jgi:hypothetical protein